MLTLVFLYSVEQIKSHPRLAHFVLSEAGAKWPTVAICTVRCFIFGWHLPNDYLNRSKSKAQVVFGQNFNLSGSWPSFLWANERIHQPPVHPFPLGNWVVQRSPSLMYWTPTPPSGGSRPTCIIEKKKKGFRVCFVFWVGFFFGGCRFVIWNRQVLIDLNCGMFLRHSGLLVPPVTQHLSRPSRDRGHGAVLQLGSDLGGATEASGNSTP